MPAGKQKLQYDVSIEMENFYSILNVKLKDPYMACTSYSQSPAWAFVCS